MGKKLLMKGNEAIAEAAIRAGCRVFRIPDNAANRDCALHGKRLPEVGGFLTGRGEIAAP